MRAETILCVLLVHHVSALCRKDEVYKICPGCPGTCQQGEPYVCFLPCVAKCVCRPGLLRDEMSRRCVKPEDCPGRTNATEVVIEGYDKLNESTTTLPDVKGAWKVKD